MSAGRARRFEGRRALVTGAVALLVGVWAAGARFGPPEIMNTDQGSQFTGSAWITTLTEAGVRVSMDGPDIHQRP